jgi:hypothetical protein
VPFRYKYLNALLDLLSSNNSDVSLISMKTLPKIGYVALLNNRPVAAGFLRRVEGGYGQIDTLTSNKYLGSIVRHQGISKVVDSLLEDAKILKLHGIISYIQHPDVLKRAQDVGFTLLPHRVISLSLTK